jgi:hypothetical protein
MKTTDRRRGKGLSRIFFVISVAIVGAVFFFPTLASLSWHTVRSSEATYLGWRVTVPNDWFVWHVNGKWHLVSMGRHMFPFKSGMFTINEPKAWWNSEKHYERTKLELGKVFGPGSLTTSEKGIAGDSFEGYCKEFRRKDWNDVICYTKDGWGFSFHGPDPFLAESYEIIFSLKR